MRLPSNLRTACRSATALSLVGLGFFLGRQSTSQTKTTPSTANTTFGRPFVSMPLAAEESAAANGRASLNAAKKTWATLQQQPTTPTSEESMCAQLKIIAASDPLQALALAQTAATPRQRELLRNAALQGWATHDSQAAASWTLTNVRAEERRIAIECLAAGAIAQPEQAVATFNYLIAADPLQASDHGNALVFAFTHAGQYDLASGFAATGPTEFRAAWLCTVYNQWATYQPQAALAALEKIPDTAACLEARAGLFAGWSNSDPALLVSYAQTLPTGDTRLQALNEGLSQWVQRDPVAASAWMDKFDPSPDLDAGAAAVAIAPALVAKKPDVAVSWAESITDPELRANTLLDLIQLWAQHDPNAARHYAATSPALRPETRELALATFQPAP
jgi:hypothetical protein